MLLFTAAIFFLLRLKILIENLLNIRILYLCTAIAILIPIFQLRSLFQEPQITVGITEKNRRCKRTIRTPRNPVIGRLALQFGPYL